MKKIVIIVFVWLTAVLLTSCHHGYPASTIIMNDDSVSIRIKYVGSIDFTKDSTAIESIYENSYISYTNNDKKLTAENDENGKMHIEMYDGNKELTMDSAGKKFMAEAVKRMISLGVEPRGDTTQK